MATTILISGVLMDGTGNPIPDCDITLTALRTSRSVVAKTSGLGATSSAGEYSLTVPPGDYRVTLCIDGYPPAEPGMIHVYADSTPGTLNDFLLAPGESDLTPDILKQLEELAKAAKASADAAAGSAATARPWRQRRKRLKRRWIMRMGDWRKTVMAAIFRTKNNLRELSAR